MKIFFTILLGLFLFSAMILSWILFQDLLTEKKRSSSLSVEAPTLRFVPSKRKELQASKQTKKPQVRIPSSPSKPMGEEAKNPTIGSSLKQAPNRAISRPEGILDGGAFADRSSKVEPSLLPEKSSASADKREPVAIAVDAKFIRENEFLAWDTWWHSPTKYSVYLHAFAPKGTELSWVRTCIRDGKEPRTMAKTRTVSKWRWRSYQLMLYGWKRHCTLTARLGEQTKILIKDFRSEKGTVPTQDQIKFYAKWHLRDGRKRQLAVIFSVRTLKAYAKISWYKSCHLKSRRNPRRKSIYKNPGKSKSNGFHSHARLVLLHAYGDFYGSCEVSVSTDNIRRVYHFTFE